jgi:hypothetical protein
VRERTGSHGLIFRWNVLPGRTIFILRFIRFFRLGLF